MRHAIGIGAQKAASSWVHDLLSMHPGICVPGEKELDFFSHRHDRGHGWYRAQFDGPGLRFENSPSYLTDPRAPARARAFNPDMRLVVSLRDPVDRAISHHLHEIAKGHIPPCDFARGLADNPDYLEQGFYARHLARWRAVFPPERMLVLFAEEIREAPQAAARDLHRFLGLDPGPVLTERRNVSDTARSPLLRQALRAGGSGMRAVAGEGPLLALKQLAPVRAVLNWNSADLRARIDLPGAAERLALAARFAHDMNALAQMTGRRALPWPSWASAGADQDAPV